MDDVITITFTRDELSTLEYLLAQPAFQDIPEVVALQEPIYRAIWEDNTEPYEYDHLGD